ncbi:MAG: DUF4920 domain-containing protein [Deltaproteobacteria bacterium]|jgi:hypothetical protein|nr:DUF4920 domain-containing protein [Deltaproteobacteria bacterium]
MKTGRIIISLILVVLLNTLAFASNVETYGEKLTLSEVTKISEILSAPEQFVGKKVLVRGLVVDVCAKRGCWMSLASDKPFEKIQIKVLDGEIVFPMSARGKEALVEGEVEVLKYSKEDVIAWLQHQAEEKGEPFDPANVTSGMTVYRIKALGAEISD